MKSPFAASAVAAMAWAYDPRGLSIARHEGCVPLGFRRTHANGGIPGPCRLHKATGRALDVSMNQRVTGLRGLPVLSAKGIKGLRRCDLPANRAICAARIAPGFGRWGSSLEVPINQSLRPENKCRIVLTAGMVPATLVGRT